MRWLLPSLSFSRPENLYFLVPLAVFALAGFFMKRRLSRKFDGFFEGESLFRSRLSSKSSLLKSLLLASAFCAMILAASGPVYKSRHPSYNFMALVDISQSMWCEDYEVNGTPVSRLEMAKRNLLSLLDALPADGRLGLGVFAGMVKPVLILTPPQPVGKSYGDLRTIIQSIRYSWTWDDGSKLEGSLLRMGDILDEKKKAYGTGLVLMVLTDGENTSYLPRGESLWDLSKFKGVHLYFAGHGTVNGAPVPQFDEHWRFKQYRADVKGDLLISRLDEGHLKELAKSYHGAYKRVERDSSLKDLASDASYKLGENRSDTDLAWQFWLAGAFLVSLFLLV